MEATNAQNLFNIQVIIIIQLVPMLESILEEVFREFSHQIQSGLVQFWACNINPDLEDIGCNLVLTGLTCNPTQDQGLEDYRNICLQKQINKQYPFVGRDVSVGNWLAGRAAQTWMADHKTIHHVLDQDDQHSEDVGARGQLVFPVMFDDGTGNIKPVGIIEYVTTERKECYGEDFERFHSLLKAEGLNSTYMGKTIKVVRNDTVIRFTLPLSAILLDLHTEVTKRFTELQNQIFRVEYNDAEGIRRLISSDGDLRFCMARSSSRGEKFIRMFVLV